MDFHFKNATKDQLDIIFSLIAKLDRAGLSEIDRWMDPEEQWRNDMTAADLIEHLMSLHVR